MRGSGLSRTIDLAGNVKRTGGLSCSIGESQGEVSGAKKERLWGILWAVEIESVHASRTGGIREC